MKTSIKTLAICGGIAASAAFLGTAQAQITFANSGGTLSSWLGTPNYSTSLSGLSVQGDATITGTYGLMAETFTPSSGFTIGSFSFIMSVNSTAPTYYVNLLDLGAAGSVSVSAGAATYGPTTGDVGTTLFNDTVSFSGIASGEIQGTFTLPSADQVALSSGEEYALEIWTPSANGAAGVTIYRGSVADAGGQMFSGADAVAGARLTLVGNGQAGGAPRTGAMALYAAPVPEPASIALFGLGGLASLVALRRKK
jgi:hypothetical protein